MSCDITAGPDGKRRGGEWRVASQQLYQSIVVQAEIRMEANQDSLNPEHILQKASAKAREIKPSLLH